MAPAVSTLSLAAEAHDPAGFAAALGRSFERYGFAIVADHGIAAPLIAAADAEARAFFALPEEAKRRYHQPSGGGQRGFTPFGIETAKGALAHDLKEFWHVGRELAPGHRLEPLMPPNLWPVERPGFRPAMLALYAAFDAVGARLLAAIARHLGLAPDFFVAPVAEGNSVLRLLHYPPVARAGRHLRAAAHEDINVITLLLGAEEAGLELRDCDGAWLPVRPDPGQLAVNIGDMLQRMTNGVLRSTTHRVANPEGPDGARPRYSMPFFLHFRPDYLIETLPGCVSAARPALHAGPITAHDYLAERLREIGLA